MQANEKKGKFIKWIANLHYSDMEPYVLNGFILFYLFYEYSGDSFPFFSEGKLLPVFTVVVLKLFLIKIDKLSDNSDGKVGYLTEIVDGCMKKKICCNELKIFSYDSQGFYHAILGKDFYAKSIVVLMHRKAYERNREIIQRWNELITKRKTSKVTIKLHEHDRIIFGMTFDSKVGVFGSFKPECIVDQDILASTKNTYSCSSKGGEVNRQIILDFNEMFEKLNATAESLSEMEE